ncbi:MAG: hypothetical protein IJ386_08825, partial [Clostridia bacterium]|nr:hypothetical protein [Clostridia bacterium]
MKNKRRLFATRLLVLACSFAMLICACGGETLVCGPDPTLEFNDSAFIHEGLIDYVRTMTPEDTVKVNILLDSGNTTALGTKLLIEEEYGIPVHVCNAIDKRDFERSDPYAREWYIANLAEGEPTFDENIDEARLEYIREYQRIYREMLEEYKRQVFADLPVREGAEIDYGTSHVRKYDATAKELSELSRSELVSFISPWTETPVEPPESVTPAYTFTDIYDELEISVIFDKEKYSYGDTLNVQFSVCNNGEDAVGLDPIIETGNNRVGDPDHVNGCYYIDADFLCDGVIRRDLSCCYGYECTTDMVKPIGILDPGETMSKTYA